MRKCSEQLPRKMRRVMLLEGAAYAPRGLCCTGWKTVARQICPAVPVHCLPATRRCCTGQHVCWTTKHALKTARMSALLATAATLRRRRSRRRNGACTGRTMGPYSTKKTVGNPFCMLHGKAILQCRGCPRIAPIAKAEHVVCF